MIQIDHAQHLARHIVTSAIEDEAVLRAGHVVISDTLCCFLENRIATMLRAHLPADQRHQRFDA